MSTILVVDDDAASCDLLREILTDQGWKVKTAQDPEAALRLVESEQFDLVISDVNLEARLSGLDLLQRFRAMCPVILVTAFGSLETAVEASREGAWDFISKPFKVDEVVSAARRALAKNGDVAAEPEDLPARYEDAGFIGRSPAMIDLYKAIARVAPTRSTVLITGESGTGKELVARAIHRHSPRAGRPFVAVNCGALTETLLETELFGHIRGSFTGAVADRKGLWEEAEGGTLFLDEVGEMSLAMQVKFLRALQEGEIKRVGATKSTKVDARIIAATNRDLEKEVAAGTFREDLFYRFSVVVLHLPPLRERGDDIVLLADHSLKQAAANLGRRLRLSREAAEALRAYAWPGNVRELSATLESAALNARGAEIMVEDLPLKLRSVEARKPRETVAPVNQLFAGLPTLDELEHRYLVHVLEAVRGNRTRAAEVLGIDRRTLYRMAERFGVKLDES